MRRKVTLKQVREAVAEAHCKDTWKMLDLIGEMLTEEDWRNLNEMHIMNTSGYEHMYYVKLDFDDDDKGILRAECYDYDEVKEFGEVAAKKVREYENEWAMEYCEWYDSHYPDVKLAFDVPLTRGFSDSSERKDTSFSMLDLEKAVQEHLDEHHGTRKVQPWELRELICADELGLTEEELEYELEEVCGY